MIGGRVGAQNMHCRYIKNALIQEEREFFRVPQIYEGVRMAKTF